MKICFVLQRRFAYSGHAIIKTLKKKYGVNEFYGYVLTRQSFDYLKSQKEIEYSQLLLDEDIHNRYKNEPLDLTYIKWLEKEYGMPNLWRYIEVDRIIRYNMLVREYPYNTPRYSHEEMMRILQVKAKAIILFLKETAPDAIVFAVVGDMSTLLLYHIAKKMNIKILFIRNSRIDEMFAITDYYQGMSSIEETFKRGPKDAYIEKARAYLNKFREKPVPPAAIDSPKEKPTTRRLQFRFLHPKGLLRSLSWFVQMSWEYAKNPHRDDYSEIKPWHYVIDRVKRKVRVLRGFNNLYDTINLKEDYAFFPLQLEPELGSLLLCPFYTDQLWLAKQIARSLPVHFKLYIKEHPAMFGYRPQSFYEELKKIPNVKLIDPCFFSFNITKNAKLIFTQTGSVGWEGLLYKKPIITFGDVFYNNLPMSKKCVAIENLPHIIQEHLEHFQHDEEALIRFIGAAIQESANVDLTRIWEVLGGGEMEKKEQELVPMADLIATTLNLKPL